MTTQYLFYILFGYLSGSVLYGYLLPKYIKKIDVTKESPDQNPGVANAFLCAGAPIGFCALMLELLKGYLPVHAAMHVLNPRHLIFGLVLAAPVLGHAFPFWNPKMGGKSIAVSFGVLLGLVPYWRPVLILAVCYLMFSIVIVIRPHFFRSVVTFAIFWGMVIIKRGPLGITTGTGILSFVVIWKHLVKYQNERLEITFPGRQEKV